MQYNVFIRCAFIPTSLASKFRVDSQCFHIKNKITTIQNTKYSMKTFTQANGTLTITSSQMKFYFKRK